MMSDARCKIRNQKWEETRVGTRNQTWRKTPELEPGPETRTGARNQNINISGVLGQGKPADLENKRSLGLDIDRDSQPGSGIQALYRYRYRKLVWISGPGRRVNM